VNILTILAILISPLIAVQVTELLNKIKLNRQRKLDIFKDLMATRAAGLSPTHVGALNRIDIEFYGVSEVSEAWKEYHDHLGLSVNIETEDTDGWRSWTDKKEDLLPEFCT